MAGSMAAVDKITDHVSQQVILNIRFEAERVANMLTTDIKRLLSLGVSQSELALALTNEVQFGGRLLGTVERTFKNAMTYPLGWIEGEAVRATMPDVDRWQWVTVQDARRCDDCSVRHGIVKTWAEWEAVGLPGYGATVCGYYCRCDLIPETGYTGPIPEPVVVKTVQEYRDAYKAGL